MGKQGNGVLSVETVKNKFQTIWEGQNYQTLQSGTSTWFMTIIKSLFFIYPACISPLVPKLHGKMKQKLALFSFYMTVSRMPLTWNFFGGWVL